MKGIMAFLVGRLGERSAKIFMGACLISASGILTGAMTWREGAAAAIVSLAHAITPDAGGAS